MNLFDSIVQLDKAATLWINNLSSSWNDAFWATLSEVTIWFPVYVLIFVFIFWKLGWKKGLAVLLTLALTILIVDQGSNLIKASVGRFRPLYDDWMVNNGLRLPYGFYPAGYFGFYSSHASNTIGFATVTYLGLKWFRPQSDWRIYGWVVYIWAVLVCISRIMMGAHFLGDVTVGALVGFGVAYGLLKLAKLPFKASR